MPMGETVCGRRGGLTNYFLHGLSSPHRRKVMVPLSELMITILLNGHMIKLPSLNPWP